MSHLSKHAELDADGFLTAKCSCGWKQPNLPDNETVTDMLMEHAAAMAGEVEHFEVARLITQLQRDQERLLKAAKAVVEADDPEAFELERLPNLIEKLQDLKTVVDGFTSVEELSGE